MLHSSVQIYVSASVLMTGREQLYFQSLKGCIFLLLGNQFCALWHKKGGRKETSALL